MATSKKSTSKKPANKKSGMSTTQAVELGAGILAATAAAGAAGYYFYGTQNAKKHRHAASSWAKGLQKDVAKRVKSLEKVDAKTVAAAVEQAAAAYRGARGVADGDLQTAATELKKNWHMMQRELAPSKQVKKTVKKVTGGKPAKAVKKAVKKAAPKKAAKKGGKK